jgi:hypothetical protein
MARLLFDANQSALEKFAQTREAIDRQTPDDIEVDSGVKMMDGKGCYQLEKVGEEYDTVAILDANNSQFTVLIDYTNNIKNGKAHVGSLEKALRKAFRTLT